MNINDFQDVHPDWNIIETLGPEDSRAAIQLLMAAMYVDGRVTRNEMNTMTGALASFPYQGGTYSRSEIGDLADETYNQLTRDDEEHDADAFITGRAGMIRGRDKRLAVLRLIAIVLSADGATEHEQEYFYAVGSKMGFDYDTTEQLLRAAWESHETSRAEMDPNIRREPTWVKGANWASERKLDPYVYPFEWRETPRRDVQ